MCAEETRIRWVQTQHRAESLYTKIVGIVMGGVESAEEKLGMVRRLRPRAASADALVQILDVVTGSAEHAKARSKEAYDDAAAYAQDKAGDARGYADAKFDEASGRYAEAAGRASEEAREAAGAGAQYWNERVEDAQHAAEHAKVEL